MIKHINGYLRRYLNKLARKLRIRDEERHREKELYFHREIKFVPSKEYYLVKHFQEYYLVKHFQWVILSNQDNLRYTDPPRYNFKLGYYLDIPEIEHLLFKIDPKYERS